MDNLQPAPFDGDVPQPVERVRFHATGSEYFRIWIVNLLLTVVTLGIYSAWAKVRRNQYFYSSTELAGSSFEYHGNPVAILKGRLIALAVLMAYSFLSRTSPVLGMLAGLAMAAIAPWFIWKSLKFRLHNTSYRGIRFHFDGDLHDAYSTYLGRPMLNAITFGVAIPFVHQRMKAYQHGESRYGNARFSFDAGVGEFYKLYGWFVLIGGGGLALLAWLVFSGTAPLDGTPAAMTRRTMETGVMVLSAYAWLFLAFPLFSSMLQNLIWSRTRLEQHRFTSGMKWGRMIFITLTNYLAVIVTLGLFLPFAQVRAMRYRLESVSMQPEGSIDDFVASNEADVSATGEGLTEFMDFDISI